jgi:uncharacterized protein YkwD
LARGRFPIVLLLFLVAALPAALQARAGDAEARLSAAAARMNARTVVQAVNEARRAHGLRPLRRAGRIGGSARGYALRMLRADFFGHLSPLRIACRCRVVGEVLAWHSGRRPRPRLAVRMWLASPGHRRLLLGPWFSRLGSGLARGEFMGRQATVWVGRLGG